MKGQTDVLRSSHMLLQQRCHDAEAYVERLMAVAEHSTDAGSVELARAVLDGEEA